VGNDGVADGSREEHKKTVSSSKQERLARVNYLLFQSALPQLFQGAHERLKIRFEVH
jgi:hypothetical protein